MRNNKQLLSKEDSISMDGRGRALDNVFAERLWLTVKYEDIFLKDYGDVRSCYLGLCDFFDRYNNRREHQSVDYYFPAQIYNGEIYFKEGCMINNTDKTT